MLQIFAAYVIDLIIGDPRHIPHPVVIIGKGIDAAEKVLRRFAAPVLGLKLSGLILTVIIVGVTYAAMRGIVKGAYRLDHWVGIITEIWFLSTTIAVKGLSSAAMEIYSLLDKGDLSEARRKVGWIVGRDTQSMDEGEITRATVETVSENIVDGIIAPLFYAFIGGVPLAMAYKAVNTLDSMVGYRNEKYMEFGWASAKFDDLCNLIPARVTGFILLITFLVTGRPVKNALKMIQRDACKHPSPNSGIPEAAMAGALGVRLGGLNYYGGVESFRAYMGDSVTGLKKAHILDTVRIMHVASVITLAAGAVVLYLIS
ncbi:MAG: cobalamin biosynthesis protein CobD [Firmicutes bacterium HGW-Firmicutes-14]|nr:MAG: cobalamin biosynthesis protein CobD [Firmicutes bacterium HGW-Firmicutes-14]